jgi:hypothetical protein
MKKSLLIAAVAIALVTSCKTKHDVNDQLSVVARDTLLTEIITYVYVRPPHSSWRTRFDPQFRSYYAKHLNKFRFEKYFKGEDGVHYFYVIRPARTAQGNTRGVGGTFKVNKQGRIVSFREVFNTPVASIPDLQERGSELFNRMIKYGHVDEYLSHPDYIEWPDNITYYDTVQYEWLVKPGL